MAEKTEQPTTFNLDDPSLYINRELSLLDFQWRVLEEAKDRHNPLLERVKFLSIVDSNLEEFFMVRVGGLRMQRDSGVAEPSPDGMTPARQLAEIRKVALRLMEDMADYFRLTMMNDLSEAGIRILSYNELTPRQQEHINGYFDEVIFPSLTPLAYDPAHPFPHISNLSLNLAVVVRDRQGQQRFARVKVPSSLPQLVPVKRSSGSLRRDGTTPRYHYFVWITQVITANLTKLFPGVEIVEAHPFHVTRNADLEIQEVEALDLLDTIEESLRQRRFGPVVRLMINKSMPRYIRDILAENLKVDGLDIYALNSPLGLSALSQLTKIDRPELKDKPFSPSVPPPLRDLRGSHSGLFSVMSTRNVLLHHPYDSFLPVIDFLKVAAQDPDVLTIKQTLYRVGNNSPIVKTLLQASRDYDKQVAVLVELKARFDEESNIGWARMLEKEGVHVAYGKPRLKTHSKIALVVRREGEHLKRYIHLATGNYNHITAQIYEDMGMLTCDEEIGADVTDLFNYLTGYSEKENYRKLLVAPVNLRTRFEIMIREEIEHQRRDGQGHLIFKMNALVDPPIIRLLYEASQAGVKVDLITRGICCLRAGVPGLSENIRVISVVGRFLEHSRIYYFRNGGQERIYLGSADLMPRNINQRVEVLFPVEDQRLINHIRDDVLSIYLTDNTKARLMLPDGTYARLRPKEGEAEINAQEWFMSKARLTGET